VDGREIARCDGRDAAHAGTVHATAGAPLALEVDCIKPGIKDPPSPDVTTMRLRWKRGDGAWEPVPAAWLRHSAQQDFETERQLR
jgi:hypothetical protein